MTDFTLGTFMLKKPVALFEEATTSEASKEHTCKSIKVTSRVSKF